MVANRWVTSAVLAPIRAAAVAASQPAWPPPMTMTSNDSERAIMADFYRETPKPGSGKFRCDRGVSRETLHLTPSPLFQVNRLRQ
jgi:hypothetical protein